MKIGDVVTILTDGYEYGTNYKKNDKAKVTDWYCGVVQICQYNSIDIWVKKEDLSFDTPEESARFNEGKVQTREIYPNFLLGMGQVLTHSRSKYDHYNWCKPTQLSTPYESAMRHLMAFQSGENLDKDTQLSHLLHVATNIMFMYYHITENPEECDDRFFKKDK